AAMASARDAGVWLATHRAVVSRQRGVVAPPARCGVATAGRCRLKGAHPWNPGRKHILTACTLACALSGRGAFGVATGIRRVANEAPPACAGRALAGMERRLR